MSLYIKECQAFAKAIMDRDAEVRARAAEVSNAEATAAEAMVPLGTRLDRLLARISLDVQRRGLSMAWLQGRLRGRQGRGANGPDLGAELRRRGWEKRRSWKKGASDTGGRWFPPAGA